MERENKISSVRRITARRTAALLPVMKEKWSGMTAPFFDGKKGGGGIKFDEKDRRIVSVDRLKAGIYTRTAGILCLWELVNKS